MMNGAESGAFYPSGGATQLSLITEPLRKWASQVTFIKGVNISGSSNHYAVRSTYSGFPIGTYESPDPNVKSVDQLIADQIASTSPTPIKSLHLGVIPADTINYYQRVGRTTLFFAPKPVDYEANPVTAFDRLFGGNVPTNGPTAHLGRLHPLRARDPRGGDDRPHDGGGPHRPQRGGQADPAQGGLERAAGQAAHAHAGQQRRLLPSVEKLRPMLQGNPKDAYKHAYFNDMFDAQVDIMARALVSGMTRVATLQAGSADNNVLVPVGPGYPHHITSHGDHLRSTDGQFPDCPNTGCCVRRTRRTRRPDCIRTGRCR